MTLSSLPFSAPFSARPTNSSRTSPWRILLIAALAFLGVSAQAATRSISVSAPPSAISGSTVYVIIGATTDATDGEHIGFLHSEYSVDGGTTWKPIAYETDAKTRIQKSLTLTAGPAGAKAIIRVRVAFRGGKAGDVDFQGTTLDWEGTWTKWQEPPSKIVTINYLAR